MRGTDASLRREKTLIVRATRAHTGTAHDGSNDTLKELAQQEQLEGRPVRLRELAAILRFADELAEGPQRTSEYMQTADKYEADSLPYHDYANCTHILIDRGTNRIIVTYDIDIPNSPTDAQRRSVLSNRLTFFYQRIRKMNQERQYARSYSELLEPFKSTEVTFNFYCGPDLLETRLGPLKMKDIVVPGDLTRDPAEFNPDYSVDALVSRVVPRCPEGSYDE